MGGRSSSHCSRSTNFRDEQYFLDKTATWEIDLPMRVLAWEDEHGKNWPGYTDPAVLAHKFQDPGCEAVFKRLTVSLDELVREAIKD